MMSFFRFLIRESAEVSHDITIARMNPVHSGHATVVNQVVNSAKQNNGGHTIFLTRSHDPKKNPLTPEQKLKHVKAAFPQSNIELTSPDAPTLLHQASKLHDSGVTKLNLHVGSDRVDDFQKILNSYNGKEGKHGYYNFNDINVLPVGGARTTASDDVDGASATKMRTAASSGNLHDFTKMAPNTMSIPQKVSMYNDTVAGMNPPVEVKPKKKKVA